MKTSYLISLFFLVACNDNTAPDALVKASAKINDKNAKAKSVYVPPAKYGAEGFYTGEFTRLKYDENKETFNNQVTICIDSLDASQVYGHSIVAGNERPFQGSYKKVNDYYQAQASEPGDHPNDGRFEFTIDTRERK